MAELTRIDFKASLASSAPPAMAGADGITTRHATAAGGDLIAGGTSPAADLHARTVVIIDDRRPRPALRLVNPVFDDVARCLMVEAIDDLGYLAACVAENVDYFVSRLGAAGDAA